jgi:hypothetical protein
MYVKMIELAYLEEIEGVKDFICKQGWDAFHRDDNIADAES